VSRRGRRFRNVEICYDSKYLTRLEYNLNHMYISLLDTLPLQVMIFKDKLYLKFVSQNPQLLGIMIPLREHKQKMRMILFYSSNTSAELRKLIASLASPNF